MTRIRTRILYDGKIDSDLRSFGNKEDATLPFDCQARIIATLLAENSNHDTT